MKESAYDDGLNWDEEFQDTMEESAFDDCVNWDEEFESVAGRDGAPSTCKDDSVINVEQPLYDNTLTTVAECHLIIMIYINCHKVTGKALIELLKLITLLCPEQFNNTGCLSSITQIQRIFPRLCCSVLYLVQVLQSLFGIG